MTGTPRACVRLGGWAGRRLVMRPVDMFGYLNIYPNSYAAPNHHRRHHLYHQHTIPVVAYLLLIFLICLILLLHALNEESDQPGLCNWPSSLPSQILQKASSLPSPIYSLSVLSSTLYAPTAFFYYVCFHTRDLVYRPLQLLVLDVLETPAG